MRGLGRVEERGWRSPFESLKDLVLVAAGRCCVANSEWTDSNRHNFRPASFGGLFVCFSLSGDPSVFGESKIRVEGFVRLRLCSKLAPSLVPDGGTHPALERFCGPSECRLGDIPQDLMSVSAIEVGRRSCDDSRREVEAELGEA